jgi:hypothetical protein
MDCDARQVRLDWRHTFIPGRDIPVGFASLDLAQLGNDIRNSAGLGFQSIFGGSNSISATPGICNASASDFEQPVSLWYSSMVSRTCAGRPRSVM